MGRLTTLLPRLFAFAVGAAILASASITLGAVALKRPAPANHPKEESAPPARTVVVPDVSAQAYVFAKGILEDAGFAWKVTGGVQGYAVNTVAGQQPAAGTVVVDTGAPTVSLTLARNGKYEERGTPENSSPYNGTVVLRPGEKLKAPTAAKKTAPAQTAAPAQKAKPKAAPAQKAKPKPAAKKKTAPATKKTTVPDHYSGAKLAHFRAPDFVAPGAPKEPQNEMPLPDRARMLDAWVTGHRRPSAANLKHYEYQHAWLVYGAKFGWWHGAEALEILIRTDRRVESLWGVSSSDEAVARAMLAHVRAQAQR